MIAIHHLHASDQLIEDLAWPFDFDVARASDDTSWIKLQPETPFTVIAGEGTGGVFIAYGNGEPSLLPILHATSEGQAGRVASNLTEFMAILMAAPYWRDLLKFSADGDIEEMRKTARFMEREYAVDFPEVPEARKRIMGLLPIPVVEDPIRLIHDSIHATDCTLVAEDGWRFESLVNHFRSSDNPNWR
ncbi:MAG: hypothetical protein MUC83_03645 [Pirellula sp.]|nr:hypothetical protein [Pirellula sp.]